MVNGTERVQQFTIERADVIAGPTVSHNAEKGGLEVRFPTKPATAILDALKAHGWRWSRFSSCWYRKASPESCANLQAILGITVDPGMLAADRAFAQSATVED